MESIGSDLIRGSIDTIILRCLHRGEMYGLEICNLIKEASGGTYILKQPTLYSSLKRLEQRKMISSYWRDSAIGGRRHYYKLTSLGIKSFESKKETWNDTKDVIDTLVEGSTSKRKKTDTILDNSPVPDEVYAKMNKAITITPYNPFAESDEYFTLPVGLKIDGKSKAKETSKAKDSDTPNEKGAQQIQMEIETKELQQEARQLQQETQQLQRYVLSQPPEPPTNRAGGHIFAKYLAPGDYAVTVANKIGIMSTNKSAKVTNFDVSIQPFVKHFGTRRQIKDFVFINKLRCVAALVVACLIAALLLVVHAELKTSYSAEEKVFFSMAYGITVTYFAIYFLLYFLSPQSKKLSGNSLREHFARLGTAFILCIIILCVNIITGLTFVNSPDYLVFWVVPCVLASAVYLEGLVQVLLRKSKIFAV